MGKIKGGNNILYREELGSFTLRTLRSLSPCNRYPVTPCRRLLVMRGG